MKKRDVAVVLPYTHSHLIMMQDRHSISKYGEEWGFWGGGIEEGETPLEAAIREMKEELSWIVDDLEFLGKRKGKVKHKKEEYEITMHIFAKQINHGGNIFRVSEGDGLELFDIEQCRELKLAGEIDYKCLDLFEKKILSKKISEK